MRKIFVSSILTLLLGLLASNALHAASTEIGGLWEFEEDFTVRHEYAPGADIPAHIDAQIIMSSTWSGGNEYITSIKIQGNIEAYYDGLSFDYDVYGYLKTQQIPYRPGITHSFMIDNNVTVKITQNSDTRLKAQFQATYDNGKTGSINFDKTFQAQRSGSSGDDGTGCNTGLAPLALTLIPIINFTRRRKNK